MNITINGDGLLATILVLAGVYLAALVIRGYAGWGMDSTDRDSWHRSGLKVYTDNATGVQYVSDGNSLVVRVDAGGKPVIGDQP